MGFFARRSRPQDCIARIARIAGELPEIMQTMDAATDTRECEADWDANRAYARDHLTEALYSLGRALNGLTVSKREPTWGGRVATVETQRKHIVSLVAELRRLETALAATEARAATAEAELAHLVEGRPLVREATADKVRRVVLWAVHPDLAENALERQWRTRLFQMLMPEIDGAMRRP